MPTWVGEMFGAVDKMSPKEFVTYLTEDAVFKFGNGPAVIGRPNIENAVSHYERFWLDHLERLGAYLDWGYQSSENPAQLPGRLKTYGINEVHLSAWYALPRCEKYYKIFIDISPLYASA